MNISVLILFFNRPEKLAALFAEVRKAQPARLFLYQDGARGEQDKAGIEACRKVVAEIDWPCEVHRLYQDKNYGCDPSNFMAQRWAFSLTDKCIVFEDDDIPSQSFFCIWGWASWARVVNKWDEHYHWLDDPVALQRIEALTQERTLRKDFLPMARAHRASGKAFYETIFHAHLLLNNQLAIVPRLNMINNRGVTDDSVHFAGSVRTLPSGYRRIFTMKRHEIAKPFKHPQYVVDHVRYRCHVYQIMAWRHPLIKAWRSIEELFLNLRYGQWRRITSALTNRIKIITFGQRFH